MTYIQLIFEVIRKQINKSASLVDLSVMVNEEIDREDTDKSRLNKCLALFSITPLLLDWVWSYGRLR